MYIAVCIADREIRETIAQILKKYNESGGRIISVRSFSSSEDFICAIENGYMPDGVFIGTCFENDADMLTITENIRNVNYFLPLFIVSRTNDSAIDAYKTNAKRFLLVPVTNMQICECLNIVQLYVKHRVSHYWCTSSGKKKIMLYFSSIIYLEAKKHDIIVKTAFNREIVLKTTLKNCLNNLPPNEFFRCHRSYIVNRAFIRLENKDSYVMSSSDVIPIGKKFK